MAKQPVAVKSRFELQRFAYYSSLFFFFFCIVLSSACQKELPPVPLGPPLVDGKHLEDRHFFLSHLKATNQDLKSWKDLAPTLQKSIAYVKRKDADKIAVDRPGLKITWGQMLHTLVTLKTLLPLLDTQPALFEEKFVWFPVSEGIMYSAYYEPLIKASRTYKEGYTPIYKVPPELARFRRKYRRYYSREVIDGQKKLEGRGLELAWAESMVDVFYLQIQGSGKLIFEDGSTVNVNYAGQNGHKYVSSGRIMREKGLLERGDIEEQRAWFDKNPDRIWEILKENPSYVFFKLGDKGAVGATGHVVDPWASLATDRNFIPLGSVVAYGVNIPVEQDALTPLRAIGFAQDVGGAIKKNRIDIFTGNGERATNVANFLDARGPAWVLVARDALNEH